MDFTPFNRLLFFLHSSPYWPVISRFSQCLLLSSHFFPISTWFFFFFQWLYLFLFISQSLFLSYCFSLLFFFFFSFPFPLSFSLSILIIFILSIFPVIPVIPSIPIFLSLTLFLLGHQSDIRLWKPSNLFFSIVFLNLTSINFDSIAGLNIFVLFIGNEWGTTRIPTYKNNHIKFFLLKVSYYSVDSDFYGKLFSFLGVLY